MASDDLRESARDLNDPPPDYNPQWGNGGASNRPESRTARFTSSLGQWLGVVDRNEGTCPCSCYTVYSDVMRFLKVDKTEV